MWDREVKRLANLPENQDKEAFLQSCLDKAKNEINGKTGLKFDYKTVKKGRKIEKIVFTINDYIQELKDMLNDPNINAVQKKAVEMILKKEGVK